MMSKRGVKRMNDIEILFGEKNPAHPESKCLMTKFEKVFSDEKLYYSIHYHHFQCKISCCFIGE